MYMEGKYFTVTEPHTVAYAEQKQRQRTRQRTRADIARERMREEEACDEQKSEEPEKNPITPEKTKSEKEKDTQKRQKQEEEVAQKQKEEREKKKQKREEKKRQREKEKEDAERMRQEKEQKRQEEKERARQVEEEKIQQKREEKEKQEEEMRRLQKQREETGHYGPIPIACGHCELQTWSLGDVWYRQQEAGGNLYCRQGRTGALLVRARDDVNAPPRISIIKGSVAGNPLATIYINGGQVIDGTYGRISITCGHCGKMDKFKRSDSIRVPQMGSGSRTMQVECSCGIRYAITTYDEHRY